MTSTVRMLGSFVGRNFRVFLRDKAAVFFSMLAPLIVFLLYILFLRDVQLDAYRNLFEQYGLELSRLEAIVDGWMIAGTLAVACVTVSFSAQNIWIRDRQNGISADFLVTPVRRSLLFAGYFLYNVLVTLFICLFVAAVGFVYLAATGWNLSVADVFGILGNMMVSVLSASLFGMLVCTFLRSENAHGASLGVLSAAIGFLSGAYMPVSMFPTAIQYIILFLPCGYSAGVFRHFFMRGAIDKLAGISAPAAEALSEAFSMNIDFFGAEIGAGVQFALLAASVVLFAAADLILVYLARRRRRITSQRAEGSAEKA